MQIQLGKGIYYVSPVVSADGVHGVMCRFTGKEHAVNSKDPDWVDGMAYIPKEEDVFIWCENKDAAHVLQTAINGMVMQMDGFKIVDAEG